MSKGTYSLTLIASTFVLMIFQPSANASNLKIDSFHSPSNLFTVKFSELKHMTFSNEEIRQSIDNINHVIYQVIFLNNMNGKKVAETKYYDVYGFNKSAGTMPVPQIFLGFEWSPDEDVVLVPTGDWASAPSSASFTAINLNPKYTWKQSSVMIDIQLWSNSSTAVGDMFTDCNYNVVKFDVKTGKVQILRKNIHVYGYQFLSFSKDSFITKEVLNNCRSDEDEKTYHPYCEKWNRQTLYSKDVTCPNIKIIP